ncbi:MAG: alpha/beta fold hydrolase [Burkholderiales bacterium]|nr:alpha/beta fold hydrolase [Burkholderiales bacterium]
MNAPEPCRAYRAPRWLRGGHAQTIYPALFLRGGLPRYRRERWDTPDGDFIDLDFLDAGPAGAPRVALFHGLEGSSSSHYAVAMMRALERARWNGVVVHFRGCSGEPNRLPRAYHSGDAPEIGWIIARLAQAGAPLYAVGVSLGGNALLKWLGESGAEPGAGLRAAAAVSAPLDLMAAGAALGQGLNLIYTRMFLATLRKKSLHKLERYPGLFDRERMLAARNLRQFDDVVTAPLHGFRDTDDYWTRASAKPVLAGVRLPTLLLNAKNDPFLPARHLPQPAEVSSLVSLEQPEEGGHVGFASDAFPGNLDWLPQRLLAFFDGHAHPVR